MQEKLSLCPPVSSKEFAVQGRIRVITSKNQTRMKRIVFLLLGMIALLPAMAQIKVKAACPPFEVDILDGKVNGLKANARFIEVKQKFPCSTSMDEEGAATAKCGAAIYFKDKDLTFFTDRDYIDIGEKFQGKLTIPLIGAARNGLFKWLGNPKIKDTDMDVFPTQYGILILRYNKASKVIRIQMSTLGPDNINLCE
jgi:hypothetical protein